MDRCGAPVCGTDAEQMNGVPLAKAESVSEFSHAEPSSPHKDHHLYFLFFLFFYILKCISDAT